MFLRRNKTLVKLFQLIPGHGPFKTLPLFFLLGAGMEYLMIHWKPWGTNITFYQVYNRNRAIELAELKFEQEQFKKQAAASGAQ